MIVQQRVAQECEEDGMENSVESVEVLNSSHAAVKVLEPMGWACGGKVTQKGPLRRGRSIQGLILRLLSSKLVYALMARQLTGAGTGPQTCSVSGRRRETCLLKSSGVLQDYTLRAILKNPPHWERTAIQTGRRKVLVLRFIHRIREHSAQIQDDLRVL